MRLIFNSLFFVSLLLTTMPQCRGQLTALPKPTLHTITSDEHQPSQTAVPPAGMGTGTGKPTSTRDPVAPTAQGPVEQSPNDNGLPQQQGPIVQPQVQTESGPEVESYAPDDSSTATAGIHEVTAGVGASHGSYSASSSGKPIPIGAIVAIVFVSSAILAACVSIFFIRRKRQQRTKRAAAGMRQLKIQTAAIGKPVPVQLGVGYSRHYAAQPGDHVSSHSQGSSYGSRAPPVSGRGDMYSSIKPGMAGIGAGGSIHSSQSTLQSRWSP